jgi:hypothetical protein
MEGHGDQHPLLRHPSNLLEVAELADSLFRQPEVHSDRRERPLSNARLADAGVSLG